MTLAELKLDLETRANSSERGAEDDERDAAYHLRRLEMDSYLRHRTCAESGRSQAWAFRQSAKALDEVTP